MNNRYVFSLFFCFRICAAEIEAVSNIDTIDDQSVQKSIIGSVITSTTNLIVTNLKTEIEEKIKVEQIEENAKAKIQTGIDQLKNNKDNKDQTGPNEPISNSGSSGNTGITQAKEKTEHKDQTGLNQLARLKNNSSQNSTESLSLETTNIVIYYTFSFLIAKYTFMKDGEYKKDEKNKIFNGYKR